MQAHKPSNKRSISLLTELACLDITGTDAAKFLQGQSTIDCYDLSNDNLKLGAVCNVKGRIIANFMACKIEPGIRLFLRRSLVEILRNHLNKYMVFFKCGFSLPDGAVWADKSDDFISGTDSGNSAYLDTKSNRLSFVLASNDAFTDNKLQSDIYRALTRSGIALFDQACSEKYLPHELAFNRLNAVDYKKGCFTGQEIIARMHYKGKLKSYLYLLTIAGSYSSFEELTENKENQLESGTKITIDDKNIGQLICAVPQTGEKQTLILANLREEAQNCQKFQLIGENMPILEVITISKLDKQ